jgi:hypothetical protein
VEVATAAASMLLLIITNLEMNVILPPFTSCQPVKGPQNTLSNPMKDYKLKAISHTRNTLQTSVRYVHEQRIKKVG